MTPDDQEIAEAMYIDEAEQERLKNKLCEDAGWFIACLFDNAYDDCAERIKALGENWAKYNDLANPPDTEGT